MRVRNSLNGVTAEVTEETARLLGAHWSPVGEASPEPEPAKAPAKKAAPRKRAAAKKSD